jgi:hypothetical protein
MSRDPIWDDLRAFSKERYDERRAANMAAAPDDGGWTKHTPYHWSRMIDGERLDYWPSKAKWQFRGKVISGNINEYKAVRPHEWVKP